ncbi:protein maelstrom [Drosophila busckii]|uniref:protein maelstrom n=1 Tax=Drosophila busckii TaxID=30019 RepID=UPI00083F353A|nr:protein maelstrom [Drosophila busckii]
MPPKKHNAFMTFVNEWKSKNKEGRHMSIPQAVTHCGDIWKNMNAQQRGPYIALAKDADVLARCTVERLNTQGQALSAVEREERDLANQIMLMKQNTERIVREGKENDDLENTKFIFAAFNYFIKAVGNDIYIPAEFAACEFSLKTGMNSIYSSHINPGQLIYGLSSDAMDHTSTTHQLPLPPNALGETNMGRLYENILEYLRGKNDPKKPVIVFTTTEMLPVVKGCLRYLESDCSDAEEGAIEVYDIRYLFFILKKEVADIADLPTDEITKTVTDNLFQKDFFEYHSGISCQFHEDNDRGRYCAHSMVSRWCFIFSDHMCADLAIKPVPGKHMPPQQEQRFSVTNPDESTAETSFQSCESAVKQERKYARYVPSDNSAFSADIKESNDFPSLGNRKSKPIPKRSAGNQASRDPRSAAYVLVTNRTAAEIDDAFKMPRRFS